MSDADHPPRRFLWYVAGLSLLLIIASVSLYVILVVIPRSAGRNLRDAAQGIASDLDTLFHTSPRITVNDTLVVTRTSPVLELATVNEQRELRHRWSHEWLGSTKQLELTGTFRLRAGFDLKRQFDLAISDAGVVVTLPPATLLTCELLTIREHGESGWWNRLSETDRDQGRIGFLAAARGSEEAHALTERAKQEAERQLGEILTRRLGERPVRFEYRE